MKRDIDAIIGLAGICIGMIGIGYAFGAHKKMNDISEKLDKSINQLSESVVVDIPDHLIDRAIEQAVNREVEGEVRRASVRVVNDIEREVKSEVSSAVNSERTKIQESVKKEIEKKVSNIDISSLKRDVIEEAKEAAAEKMDSSLDDILEQFNDELHTVSKIYNSIAKAITKDRDSETILRI